MPRARRSPAGEAPVQPQGVSKPRRLPVRWDHRKDKFLLLAIFSQMNVTAPDFKQLSDVLGSEIYSAGVLRRRFKDLRDIATEVMEDRQQRGIEASEVGLEDDKIILQDEPLIETPVSSPAPSPEPSTLPQDLENGLEDDGIILQDEPLVKALAPSPKPFALSQGLEQRAAELTPPASKASTPTHLSSKARASTVPPPPKTPLPSVGSSKPHPHSLPHKPSTQVPPRRPEQNRPQDHGPAPRGPKNNKPDSTLQKTKQRPSKRRQKAGGRYFIGEDRSTDHRPTNPVKPWTPFVQTPQVGVTSGGWHNKAILTGPRHLTWAQGNLEGANSGGQAHRNREDFVFPTVYER
ncbi:hypothetical protein BDV12DRAFT_199502 [Aspergillus spectabilis]